MPDPCQTDAFRKAIDLFNRRAFFECHEVLEDLWRPLPPSPEKLFLQSVIQIAVGLHHWQNGNFTGARNKLQEGLEKLTQLQTYTDYTPPITLGGLRRQGQQALAFLLALGPEGCPDSSPPTIQV